MTIKLTPQEIVNWLLWLADQIVAAGFAAVFVGVIVRYWGVAFPLVPSSDPTNLAYYAGAWWLYRKARG